MPLYKPNIDSVGYGGHPSEVDEADAFSELPFLPTVGDDDVEAVVAFEVVLRNSLLTAIGECKICEAEYEEVLDAWLGEIRAMVVVEFWPELVGVEAAIQGLSKIQTLKRTVPNRKLFRSSMVKAL